MKLFMFHAKSYYDDPTFAEEKAYVSREACETARDAFAARADRGDAETYKAAWSDWYPIIEIEVVQ